MMTYIFNDLLEDLRAQAGHISQKASQNRGKPSFQPFRRQKSADSVSESEEEDPEVTAQLAMEDLKKRNEQRKNSSVFRGTSVERQRAPNEQPDQPAADGASFDEAPSAKTATKIATKTATKTAAKTTSAKRPESREAISEVPRQNTKTNADTTSKAQSNKAQTTDGDKTNTTTTTPASPQTQNTPTESSTMSDKPKNTGSHTGTPSNTGALPSINDRKKEIPFGEFLNGDGTAYQRADPVKYTMADAMHYPSGFAMKNTAFASPSVKVAYDDNGQPGWMMTGTNVPKVFRTQKSVLPLSVLMREQFLGFLNDDGSMDREAATLLENGYVVDNLKQASVRFFEALSICRNANNGNMSPEYQRALAQFAQFGHAVLSMLKSYGLDKGIPQFGFAQSPAPTTGTGYTTASQPSPSGTNLTRTTGRSAYDGSSDWYIDELASRRNAMQRIQEDPQLWYLRGLNF